MTAQMFMTMDFQFGGGHARAALAQYYVNDVCPLLEGRFTEEVGRRLFSAAAEVAQLLGWTAYDIGRHGLAQRYLIQALRLAPGGGRPDDGWSAAVEHEPPGHLPRKF
ncbi:MAG TPA: hypothetical protein VMU94_24170 [Streptosporangiaceae bacterium]|nr:hypothetical protein [Streptosporangiaceae bacterium]